MSHHHSKTEWDDEPHSSEGGVGPGIGSPFHDSQHQQHQNPSSSFSPSSSSNYHRQHQQQDYEDTEEQYPVGRPLSYFPTHHQPLHQNEFEDEDPGAQRTSQYHQMSPLQHAHSPLSSRAVEWSGGGYSGYQPPEIPMGGIDIISSNLEATRNGKQFSDTRTAENMSPLPTSPTYNNYASGGAGVGGNSGSGQYYQQQNRQSSTGSNPQYDGTAHEQQYGQHPDGTTGPTSSQRSGGDVENGGEDVPKVLLDPKVRGQLENRKKWKPWFIWVVSGLQIAMLVFELVKGQQRTGSFIQTSPFNPMIGPGPGTIIATGARFVPCMRSTYLDNERMQCPDDVTKICTISDICAFTPINTTGKPPNQWFRFITPIFLHGGVIHLLFNLMFQLRTGADLERDMGWWRIGIIYMVAGIVGFVFGGNFAPLLSPSMGASGSIFGLIGCLVLDLIQNWKLVIRPCWELSKLSLMILVSFAFGLLPFLDNFAHIGGFLGGILAGLVFMPVVYFSKRDKYIKLGLRIAAVPLIIVVLVVGITSFYKGENNCTWCRYLSCLPINGWCDAFDPPRAPIPGP